MRRAPGSKGGPSRSAKPGPSKPKATTPPPLPPKSSDASDDDDHDDADLGEDADALPELEDDESDEFEEDRQRTTGVAMWEDDEGELDDDDDESGSSVGEPSGSDDDDDDEAPRLTASAKGKGRDREMARIQEEMRSLPISAIMKAKRTLARGQSTVAGGVDPDDAERAEKVAAAREKLAALMRAKQGLPAEPAHAEDEQPEGRRERERREKVKRADKHAPSEVTSKKPVSRRRTVVDVDKVERRDPRFSSLSGTVDEHLHAKSYGFLSSLVADEYGAGQDALKAAQKALRTSSKALRPEREANVDQAERELARLRTRKELDERTRREREAVQGWKQEERKKQAEGKGQWHMKDSEKKRLLVEAKHAALLERGGQFAVKKALEKKRKKDAGKEKKARPRGLGFGPARPAADGSAPARKRVKM